MAKKTNMRSHGQKDQQNKSSKKKKICFVGLFGYERISDEILEVMALLDVMALLEVMTKKTNKRNFFF